MEYIKYRGKEYPIHLGFYAFKMIKNEAGKNLNEIGDNFEVLETLMYYALKAGHKIEGKKWLWFFPALFLFKKKDMNKILSVHFEWFMDFVSRNVPTPDKTKKKTKQKESHSTMLMN